MGALVGMAFDALVRALTFAAAALAALVLGLAALVVALVGLVAAVVAALSVLGSAMLRALSFLGHAIACVLVVCAVMVVGVWSFVVIYGAYGGDAAAMIPAGVATLLPLAYAATFPSIWSGLLFAVAVMGAIGAIVSAIDPIARAFVVGGALGAGVITVVGDKLTKRLEESHAVNAKEQHALGVGGDRPADDLLGRTESKPDSVDAEQ